MFRILTLLTLLTMVSCAGRETKPFQKENLPEILQEFSELRLHYNMQGKGTERNSTVMEEILKEKNINPASFYAYLEKNEKDMAVKLFGRK